MGIVYDGFDPVIERRVAIKTIAKESIDPSEAADLLGRFKREAQAAGRLNHPGIVSIHDYGEDDGLAFIAMEFIKGSELKKYFQSQQRFGLTHIVRIMCDILDALDHAHRNGVVHRDIKPANIMITDEGRVKVADFGVAWIESSTMTQVGMRIGTPAYMSPEQHQGLAVSGRSDLFSAGVILYQFLTGERPFTGSGYPLIHQILLQDPIPPSEINPDIPHALDTVTMKALAKRPENRFATAREFAEAFRKAATGESVAADFDFVLNDEALPVNSPGAMPPPGPAQGTTTIVASAIGDDGSNPSNISLEAELEYWKEIKDSTEAADFATFLEVFPGSRFAPLARRRMNRLQAEAKTGREAGEQGQPEDAGRAPFEAEQAAEGAAEEAVRRVQPDRESLATESQPRHGAQEQRRHEEEETRLLAEAATPHATEAYAGKEAEAQARQEAAEQGRREAEARERDEARAPRQRDADKRAWRIDAEEPKLVLELQDEANDATLAMGLPPVSMQPASATVGLEHFKAVSGPVHARHRAAEAEHARDDVSLPLRPFVSGRSRKLPLLPITVVLAAMLAGSGMWYAAQPELAPIVTTLRSKVQALLTTGLEAPVAEAQTGETEQAAQQRKNEEALQAERKRQSELARQKEEAAKAAANQKYEHALALLNQGGTGEAVRLLRQLAFDGHGLAAKTLGDLYSSGEKVLYDMEEAARFYAIAERNGVKIERPALSAVGRWPPDR